MPIDHINRAISISALIVSVLAFLFGGYLTATWTVSVNQRSVIPSIDSIRHETVVLPEQEIQIPPDLQEASDSARYFPDLESTMTRGELEEILNRTRFVDFQAASVNLRAAASELAREDITLAETARIWRRVSSSDKAVLFTMRSVRLLADELRPTEDSIPDIVERFLGQQLSLGDAEDEDEEEEEDSILRFAEPEVRAILQQVLIEVTRQEIIPDAQFLVSTINEEIPPLDALASEYVRLSSDVDEVLARYGADTIWETNVKLYNDGGSPAALLPIAAMAVQRQGRGNTVVLMRARQADGNIIVAPGEGIDVTFRGSVDDNSEESLRSLVDVFRNGERDFKLAFQYLDGERIESGISSFSVSVSESLRDALGEYAENVDLTNDTQ